MTASYDLMMAQYGVPRGLSGSYPSDYDDVNAPYTPAWAEKYTGIDRKTPPMCNRRCPTCRVAQNPTPKISPNQVFENPFAQTQEPNFLVRGEGFLSVWDIGMRVLAKGFLQVPLDLPMNR